MLGRFLMLFVVCQVLASAPAAASTIYSVLGSTPCGSTFDQSGSSTQTDGVSDDCGQVQGTSSQSGLGVFAQTGFGGSSAGASLLTQFAIVSPTGTPELLTVSLNLEFEAQFSGAAPGPSGESERYAEFGISLLGTTGFNYSELYQQRVSATTQNWHYVNGVIVSNDALACAPCSITTPTFQIWTDTQYDLRMFLTAHALSRSFFGLTTVDAMNTFYFPLNLNVFNGLPGGYTVDIAALNIFGNRVAGFDNPTAVPEPATLVMVGLGLVAGARAAGRRRARM